MGDRSAGQEKGSREESKERVALWCSWKFSLGEVLTEVPWWKWRRKVSLAMCGGLHLKRD